MMAALVVPVAGANPIGCMATHCAWEMAECLTDTVCRTWNMCTARCQFDDLGCQMRCADLYKPTDSTSEKIDKLSICLISVNHCVPQVNETCKVPDDAAVLAKSFDVKEMAGTWYITKGWNPLFDCFDCQVHSFAASEGNKLTLNLKYAIKKDLECAAPHCEYMQRGVTQRFVQDASNQGHLINHGNSIEELHYADDWYVLAAKPDTYSLVYYCGCNDARCGYAGAVLYTRSPDYQSLSADDKAAITAAVKAANVPGFTFEKLCTPSGAACDASSQINI